MQDKLRAVLRVGHVPGIGPPARMPEVARPWTSQSIFITGAMFDCTAKHIQRLSLQQLHHAEVNKQPLLRYDIVTT
jgi:hypothetical protein